MLPLLVEAETLLRLSNCCLVNFGLCSQPTATLAPIHLLLLLLTFVPRLLLLDKQYWFSRFTKVTVSSLRVQCSERVANRFFSGSSADASAKEVRASLLGWTHRREGADDHHRMQHLFPLHVKGLTGDGGHFKF